MKDVQLVIIDPEVDFCDPGGALFVPGADQDIIRLAALINRVGKKISKIHCTLDCHHLIDIAHPVFWVDEAGKHPNPFTIIAAGDPKWRTVQPSWQKRADEYRKSLETNGRYPLCIWPPHCLIGTPGNTIVPILMDALFRWQVKHMRTINFVSKGSNPWTEHYSAVKADVPDPQDPTSQLNTGFISTVMEADMLLLSGEAGSHCLANTVRDIADNCGDEKLIGKFMLLEDATSPVAGFEDLQDQFIADLTKRGMRTDTTVELWK